LATLSVILPAFNEEASIAGVLERIAGVRTAIGRLGLALEVIVVDDGSRDRTAVRARCYPGVRVVRHRSNTGYGAALKTGFRHASGDLLAFLDADGTYPPESLPALCETALQSDADLVVGSRMSGSRSRMSAVRRFGNAGYAGLLSAIGRVPVRDTSSGMRVLRRAALGQLYPLPDGLEFTPAMSTRAVHEDLRIVEVPIPYDSRVGDSKLSLVRDGLQFTKAIVWTALSYNPVRILGVVSVALMALAAIVALGVLLRGTGSTLDVTAFAALAAAGVCAAVAVSLFSLGAMFNYLVSLFHRRPVRQGLFGKPIFVPPLDHYFGWIGALAVLAGGVLGTTALIGLGGAAHGGRPWLLLLVASLLVVVGVELSIAWIVMRVLEELAQRSLSVARDQEMDLVEQEQVSAG
jgi:hypothetical protein